MKEFNRRTTYRAVVKYPVDSTDREKLRALRDGLGFILCEMLELGLDLEDVDNALDDARAMAEEEWSVLVELEGKP